MDKQTDGRVDEQTDGRTDKRTNEQDAALYDKIVFSFIIISIFLFLKSTKFQNIFLLFNYKFL